MAFYRCGGGGGGSQIKIETPNAGSGEIKINIPTGYSKIKCHITGGSCDFRIYKNGTMIGYGSTLALDAWYDLGTFTTAYLNYYGTFAVGTYVLIE